MAYKNRIPVAEPVLAGNEKRYVNECLDRAWISGSGKYVNAFEEQFAAFCNVKHAIGVFNGTVALHVALLVLGIQPGDEVIVPDLTYIASPNAVVYCGATPIFADVDPRTWTLDPADVAHKITPRTKAIMPVHLYGHPAAMKPLCDLAKQHGIFIVEDAAEAHGAEYNARRVGGIGEIATFSFFGNKIITTGEGGIVTTNSDDFADQVRLYKGQGMDPHRRYWFPVVGYNYRMTNIQAAIGLAQLERIEWFIERRLEVADWYNEALADVDGLILPTQAEWARNVYWLYSMGLPDYIDRDMLIRQLDEQGIETRPFFYPMHILPPYEDRDGDDKFPVTTALSKRGINLPSSAKLSREDVKYVCQAITTSIDEQIQAKIPA
jgi:perosamine synthetase